MRIRHLLIILLCIIIFLGCGGGGGSGVGPELVSGQISGQIIFDETLGNERAIIASHSTLRTSTFDNALVFLEEMPSRAVYADADGKFIFTDLPLDTSFHVIARVNSFNGNSYKSRSEVINLTKSKAHITENIRIDKDSEAKYQIRLQVKDTRDNNVARCKIWFWGEEFTLDESGSYLSPKMPLGASGNLKIIPPSNKDLLTLDCNIDSTTFQSEIQGVSAVTLPPLGITQKKAPYVSIKVGETLPGGFAIRLYGNAIDPQNDTLDLEWSASIGSFTYESIDKKYVDWAVPTEQTTAIITLKATQVSSLIYPMFWSQAELPIKISKNGTISYPGEIVVTPVSRVFDILSSATEQITGNTVSSYEIIASFPNDSNLSYTWENSDGSIISGVNSKRMFWRSPALSANESKLATLTAYVSDDIATVTKNILVKVTTFPVVTFSSPADSEFYPGLISFRGSAKDYLGNFISYENFKWYLATFPNELQLLQSEGASFSYDFISQGSYTVYLSAKDSSGVVGTGSMLISIFNCPPDISILSPENDGGYSSKNHLVFKAKVSDYEDGEITAPEQIKWFSDIDGLIGSGTYFINDKLTKNRKHSISVEAIDSMGEISSISIIIWYDMPARIVLTPESGAVFFEGSEIAFSARGVDANGAILASSTYKWYLDGSDTPWKRGIDSFVANDLSAGLHSIKVVGSNDYGNVTSEDYYFEVSWPLPKIISPASGTRFDPETDITFIATPLSTGSLELSWQIDDRESLASNNKLTKKLDVGRHTICYQGMDNSWVFASSSIDIVVERLPQIELNIASGSSFFINQQIAFHAECKDSFNNSIGNENIKWYFLDSGSPVLWKTGSLFYMNQGSSEGALAPGLHIIRVEATGPYGSIASKSFSFESGIAPIDIEKPLPDTSYKANENILFEANLKKESMPVAWYIDNVLIHTGSTPFNHSFESNGIYSVKAIATDSANVATSKEMLLCVGLNPVIDFYVKNVNDVKIDPSDSIIFEGKPIVFVGSGTNPIDNNSISGNYMTWSIYSEDGTTIQQSYSEQSELTLTISNLSSLSPGTRTVELKCQLNDGLVGKKTKQIYFNLPVATYTYPASDTFIPFDDYTSETIVCSADGYPDSVGGVNYDWYLNWGKEGCTKLEDDDIASDGIQLRLNKGENYLTLVATDSLGQVSAITKKIIVDNRPVLAFSPPKDYANLDAYIFDTCEVTLKASGSTAVESGSLLTNYKWYLGEDFINAKTSINGEITGSELGLVKGKNVVTLTAEDQFGLVATVSHNIYCGEQLPSILSPEDNQVFQNIGFAIVATGSENIHMNWILNDDELVDELSNELVFVVDDSRLKNGTNIITYRGKDSADNEKKVSLNFNYANSDYLPKIEMKFASSNNTAVKDSVLFEFEDSDNITINGSAIDGSNNPIDASKMTWTLHKQGAENDKTLFESVSSLNLSRSHLNSVGTWTLSLTATDESGFNTTEIQDFYYGYPKPKIQTPPNESLFSYTYNRTIELEGSHSDLVSIDMDWNIDGVKEGSGKTYTHVFNRGYHTIEYIGTDSAGVTKQDNVVLIVNDNPSVEFSFKKIDVSYSGFEDHSKFFEGCDLELLGTATKADGTELEDSNVAWLKYTSETDSGTNLITGTKNPILTNSMLGVGTWYLSFKAEDKDFSSYGFSESYISSMTKKITTGIEIPRFIGAIDGERIDENGSITFTVNDISPIEGYWSVEGQAASYSVTVKSGDNMIFTLDNGELSLSRGNHKVYYTGTDSTGKTYTAETSILIDSGPKFKTGFPQISSPFEQLGTATIDGLDYIIIKSDSNVQNLELKVDTDSEFDSVSWTNLGGNHNSTDRSFSRNFLVGSYTYKVTITDEFGVNNSATLSFWIWRYATYDSASPTYIVTNNNSELFIVENEKTLAKYTRIIDEGAFNSGDIASVSSCTGDVDIAGLCYANSNLYSLTKDLKYYKWNTSELATDSEQSINDSSITDIGGFLIKNNRVYISDKSSSDNYVKIFYSSGTIWGHSSSLFKRLSGITADSGNNIYVADIDNNKIIILDLDGNDEDHIDGINSPLGLAYSATSNRMYATGKTSDNNPCVYVIDLSTYTVLYSFELDGAYDLAICGTGTNSDLYITDKDGKIIRLRSNYSW